MYLHYSLWSYPLIALCLNHEIVIFMVPVLCRSAELSVCSGLLGALTSAFRCLAQDRESPGSTWVLIRSTFVLPLRVVMKPAEPGSYRMGILGCFSAMPRNLPKAALHLVSHFKPC